MAKTVKGREKTWEIQELLGEGDAGQVLRVSSDNGHLKAVMKRPVQNVSGGTILRQASQIENESLILHALEGLNASHAGIHVTVPLLLDRSIEGTSQTANLFMITQEAPGTPIAGILKGIVRGDNVISQVLVLRILAGLLQLLKAVHAKGFIWNDVKMEHVYWDESKNSFCFIDWGNSQEVQGDAQEQANRFRLDYQQLFPEGVLLIRQTAPELIQEIGWPLDGKPLSDNELIQLQFRVEYAAEYFSHRVIEYQLLFRKNLEQISDLQGLQDLLSLRSALARMGVKVDDDLALQAGRQAALASIALKDYASAEQAAQLLLQELPNEKTGNWQSVAMLFKAASLTSESVFSILLEAAIKGERQTFLWHLIALPEARLPLGLRSQLILAARILWQANASLQPACKEELTQYADELHMMALRSERFATPEEVKSEINRVSAQIDPLLANWQNLPEGRQLGWQALAVREAIQSTPIRPQANLNQALNLLLGKIRQLYKAWEAKELGNVKTELGELLLLDPSQAYLLDVEAEISKLEAWMVQLKEGPKGQVSINEFAKELTEGFPKAHFWLGLPAWLQDLWEEASTLAQGQDMLSLQNKAEALAWELPWLKLSSSFVELPANWVQNFLMNPAQKQAVADFHLCMRSGKAPVVALENIHQIMPAFYSGYVQISEAFAALWTQSQSSSKFPEPENFPPEDKPNFQEALLAFRKMEEWKELNRQNRPWASPAAHGPLSQWVTVQDLIQVQKEWRNQIQPLLALIKQKEWERLPDSDSETQAQNLLLKACHHLMMANQEWKKIPNQGLYSELIRELQYQLETAQNAFFKYWKSLQLSEKLSMRWLAEEHQPIFSNTNHTMLQMIRHLKNLAMAFEVVNTPEMARTRLAHNSAGDLMFSLVQLLDLFENPSHRQTVLRDWQKQYLDLQQRMDRQSIIDGIRSIESIHPLLPWFDELVRRDADYFNQPLIQD
ncbi:MAG: hypothetical protein VB108_09420 [Anaerolineaceae bacterium]|nr:hypothetical protein [Anaerolineaceae bacterium]